KAVLGARPSIASDEELVALTGCVPQCACPLGHAAAITLVFDDAIFQHEYLLFSPGPPERTLEVSTADLARLLPTLPNRVLNYRSS
ncbi:MAG TPA: YbaK/EbsC family protein, partial [Xanthomonadales bacterium]|nr:YbaK/EbsC family protein [Xanthomonadales bacterium]